MAYVVGVLVLLVGLAISIGVHEAGHLVPAKRFGVRVPRYMIGFGPTLWSRTWGETEYGVKAIPLGGFTKLVGMFPPAEEVGAKPGSGAMAELVKEARDASAEEIIPGEEHRAFYRLSTPKKVIVMAGGTLSNLVLAVVLIAIIGLGFGLPVTSTTVGMVGQCVYPADATNEYECTDADQASPGAKAGIQVGDVLVSFDGQAVKEWADFTAAVRDSEGDGVPLVVERDGEQVTLTVDPVTTERPVFDDEGQVVVDADGEMVTEDIRYVGINPMTVRERQSVGEVIPLIGETVWKSAEAVWNLPGNLGNLANALLGRGERDGSVVGLVGMGQMAGEIAAADAPGFGVSDQVADMLALVASLNIALFLFNLIPLVPLDGGHVAGALWEGAKRQVARMQGRPRPAPADTARMMPLAYGVFLLFAGLTLFLVVADLVKPVTG